MGSRRDNPLYQTPAWRATRRRVMERDGFRCKIQLPGCQGRAGAVDHIVELADGGAWFADDNLQAACVPCNSAKGNRAQMRRLGQVRTW